MTFVDERLHAERSSTRSVMACTIPQAVRIITDSPDVPVHVWRVSLGGLHAIPIPSYGTFSTGDSYVVLSTIKTAEGIKRKIYLWQGTTSSVDEIGASASLAKDLDDALGGSPEQVRMVQGEEPDEFKQLFPDGLNFRHGGVASSFRSASARPKPPAKLFIVKSPAPGKQAQVTEVRVAPSSLVSNASLVLDDDASNTLYVWHGASAGLREKSKALDTANTFRFNRGQLRLTVMDQDDVDSADASAFYAVLGSQNPAGTAAAITTCEGAVPAGAALNGVADGAAAGGGATEGKLYRVDEASVDGTVISPPSRTALDRSKQFLLVAGGRGWLWVGSKAGLPHIQVAQRHARSSGLTGDVEVVKDRLEPGLFMTFFPDWGKAEYAAFEAYQAAHAPALGFASTGLPTSPSASPTDWAAIAQKMVADCDAAVKMAGTNGQPTPTSAASLTNSRVTVYVVVGHELSQVSGPEVGHFFAGEAYVVLHEWTTNTGDERQVINFWQGRHATNLEQGAAALLATDLHNNKFKGTSALVRVAQQSEPPHLVALFEGRMVVHKGQRPERGLPTGGQGVSGPRLYQIKCEGSQSAHAVEVELSASSLNSGDCFLIKEAGGSVLLWHGVASSEAEHELGMTVAAQLGSSSVTKLKEGEESSQFWSDLGGKADYPKISSRTARRTAVLFRIRDAGRAGVNIEASSVFSQEDLDTLDNSILDTGDALCVWCGREAPPTERLHAHQAVEAYAKARGQTMNVVDVEDGAEPPFFTQHFAGWDSTKRSSIVAAMAKLKPVPTSP